MDREQMIKLAAEFGAAHQVHINRDDALAVIHEAMADFAIEQVKAERKRIAQLLRDIQLECTTPALIEVYRVCHRLQKDLEAE